MTSYEIVCIQKSSGLLSQNQKITHIGYNNGQSIQKIPIQQAIQMIQNRLCTFFVKDKRTQKSVNVIVVNQSSGLLYNNEYLRTIANGIETDNLEQLPEC
ncbi:MAG: hypothetical protein LEGION0403_FIIPPAGN_02821 [Legionella sp.]|uniref:DUF3892 domain-containing protein n=1 Tax=Legionella sp. TaxID=459 RepID=UPI003D14A871